MSIFHTDQRSIRDIRAELLERPCDQDDLAAVCIILCDRIIALEERLDESDDEPNPYLLTGDELKEAEAHQNAGR